MRELNLDSDAYPFQSRYFDTPAGQLHYIDEGQGEPVVMVHGNPTWSFAFRHCIAALRSQYRCIAMDHIGFGLSDKPLEWDYQPQSHAAHFAALMDSLDLQSITLVVSDWGGPIALQYAIDHPDRIKRVVVLNSWCWSVKGDPHFERFSAMMGGPIGRFLIKHCNFFVNGVMKKAVHQKHCLTQNVMRHYRLTTANKRARKSMWVLPKAIVSCSEWLSTLERGIKQQLANKPCLIAWGKHDIAFRAQECERWQRLFTQHTLVSFDHAGHFPEEEVPDELVSHLQGFLQQDNA